MKLRNKLNFAVVLLIVILVLSFVGADYSRSILGTFSSEQSSENFESSMCETGQDFIIQIAPSGCTPTVVRSDLLEEQNVPIYCQLAATKVNPLINVEAIDSISFPEGNYSNEFIQGIGFHPAQAALGVEDNLNSPVLNNIGYVVILLKEQNNASSMPEFVEGTLTAKVSYDIETLFGIGKASFYLPELDNSEWENNYVQYSLWNGKAYLRAEFISEDQATISLYDSNLKKVSTGVLKVGESSGKIYISGFDCMAGLEIKLVGLENPDRRVKLRVDDDVIEVSQGDNFLDNRCKVVNFKDDFGESVTIKCKVDDGSGNINLKIQPKIKLNFDGANDEGYEIGDWLYDTENFKSVYLGAVGTHGNTGKSEDLYVYLVETKKKAQLDEEDLKDVNNFAKFNTPKRVSSIPFVDFVAQAGKNIAGLVALIDKLTNKGMKINYFSKTYVDNSGDIKISSAQDMFGRNVQIEGFATLSDKELSPEAQTYYQEAMNDYDTILDSFAAEEDSDGLTYGKKVLTQKIILAGDMGQKETVVELCDEFEEKYSSFSDEIKEKCNDKYKLSSSEIASKIVLINGEYRKITFEGVYEPSWDEFSVKVYVKGAGEEYTESRTIQKNDKIYLSDSEFILLRDLENDKAIFDVSGVKGWKENLVSSNAEIPLNDYKIIGDGHYQIRVDEISLRKTAQVSVIPDVEHSGTEANFSFKVGIEQRAIDLSPEKTKKMIEDLNETIERWTEISEFLGKSVKAFKGACLATGAVLTVKNFWANTGGKSIARQNVMRGAGGWYEQCTDSVKSGNYSSVDECLSDNGDKIEEDVDTFYEVLQEQNEDIKKLEKDSTKEGGFLSQDVVNTDEFMQDYVPQVQEYLETNLGSSIEDPDNKASSIDSAKVVDLLSYNNWVERGYSLEQIKEIELYTKVLEADPDNEIAKKGLYSVAAEVQGASAEIEERKSLVDKLAASGLSNVRVRPFDDAKTKVEFYDGAVVSGSFGGLASGTPVQAITYAGSSYVLELSELGNGQYEVKNVYDISGNKVSDDEKNKIMSLYAYFKEYDRSSYENEFKSSFGENEALVRYFETEPYKGLPAIVPFDLDEGWYAATKQTLPILGNIQAYDDSGRVTSFWLCNVGENGIEEFDSVGDDICQMVNSGTGQPYNQFAGLSESEATKIIGCAQDAILDASKAYKSGVNSVTIGTSCGGSFSIGVGSPAIDVPDMQCSDFMSVKDCKLLFNVCDPVICPSSRCDLGGAYPVQDVVQSGIIGSIALCLPNAREGIVFPVCLSGINAGVEGLLSVYNSYHDCLQESLDTGQLVGVCDEIYSVYMCEFLWRQAQPLSKIAIPKIVEKLLGQDTRGGGEYLGVQSAWENVETSSNYFTQYYRENAYAAFKARSAESAGGEICKSYVSGVFPEGGDLLDSLTEPDSPPQFYGNFDEIPFTTATSPPTSQYKVFYHIYAGKDSGAYYNVYLKGSSETSFYQDTSSSRVVASGYIGTGEYASETVDFTATSGYQQMCINVNNYEECGFQQVTTDFALDYVTDKYLEEQASQTDITKTSECISGSASAYSLLNPNVQEGVDEVINPEIYNQGIIRFCATDNPGQGTDAYAGGEDARWVDVGYCDNEAVRCWLDTQSVEEVIKNSDIEADTLEEVTQNSLDILTNSEGYLGENDFDVKINDIQTLIDDGDYDEAISQVDENLDNVFWNSEKAKLIFLRGTANEKLALDEYKESTKDEATISDSQILEEEKEAESRETTGIETSEEQESESEIVEGESCNVNGDIQSNDFNDLLKISDLRQRILKAAEMLEGEPVEIEGTLNCFTSVKYIYDTLNVPLYCGYSDEDGKEYSINGDVVKIGVDKRSGEVIFKNFNSPLTECELNVEKKTNDVTSEEKLDFIQPGDLLQIVWNKNFGHAVIFIEWVDRDKGIARLFDWNGPKDVDNKKTYEYYEETLTDIDNHPVYVVSSPDQKEISSPLGEVETGTEKEIEEANIGADYVSPRFEVQLWITGVVDVNYRYFNKEWHWSFGTEKWTSMNNFVDIDSKELDDEHKAIVKSLRGKGYSDGLEILLDNLKRRTGVFQPKMRMRHGEITITKVEGKDYLMFNIFDKLGNDMVYFTYYSDNWFVTFDKFFVKWYSVSDAVYDTQEHIISWDANGKHYESEIDFEDTINLILALENKNFMQGAVSICNTFYEDNAEGEKTIEEEKFSLREGIDATKFNEVQESIITREKNCEYCNLFSEDCTKEVCEAIGVQLGEKCSYELSKILANQEEEEFICKTVKWKETESPLEIYDLESALKKIGELIEWYGSEQIKLDLNYETKQFLWDLYLNDIISEKEYKDYKGGFFNYKSLGDLKDLLESKR